MATGAALMWPAVLGMTFQALPPGRRALAGGLVIGVAGIGNAIGPLVGGALTEGASWRLVFAVNIPLVLVAICAHCAGTCTSRSSGIPTPASTPVAWRLLAVGLVALLLALDLAADGDLRATDLAGPARAVRRDGRWRSSLVERRVGDRALVPRTTSWSTGRFRATCVAGIFMSIPLFTVMLFLPQYFSKVQGYGAFGAGLALLPLMVSFALTSFIAGRQRRACRRLAAGEHRCRRPVHRHVHALVPRQQRHVHQRAGRDGRARNRHRPVQLGGHRGRRHVARRVARQPRRRRALHVPGRGRDGRAGVDDGGVRARVPPVAAVRRRPASAARPPRSSCGTCRAMLAGTEIVEGGPVATALGRRHRGRRRHRRLRRLACSGRSDSTGSS